MSVAIGIAHPREVVASRATVRKRAAGAAIPPTAATMGKRALRNEFSSPTSTSRLISRPTRRKKIAIRKSFTQRMSGFVRPKLRAPIVISEVQSS